MTSLCEYLEAAADLSRTHIVLYPKYRQVECEMNTHGTGLHPRDKHVTVEEIEERLQRVALVWTEFFTTQMSTVYGSRATFYAWHDEQAGILQFSMTSRPPSELPFGATVALLDSPRPILQQLLADPHPGTIPWDELTVVTPDNEAEMLSNEAEWLSAYVLPVWAITRTW